MTVNGRIRYLSQPAPVNMGDEWFGLTDATHFWIRRRAEVLDRLAGTAVKRASAMADVGCGHGLLQQYIEDHYHRDVTGFDLNEIALRQNVSQTSAVCCYDLFQKAPEYKNQFDLIFLFDVLEHVSDEDGFIDAIRFHLAPHGKIVINVPALQSLYSKYDEAVMHVRRYNIGYLNQVAERNAMKVEAWSYWGLPMLPLLAVRKFWLLTQPKEKVISGGMDSRGPVLNRLLLGLSRCEVIPQHILGTSLMAILGERNSESAA